MGHWNQSFRLNGSGPPAKVIPPMPSGHSQCLRYGIEGRRCRTQSWTDGSLHTTDGGNVEPLAHLETLEGEQRQQRLGAAPGNLAPSCKRRAS